ncbi:hypothetical protein SCLCIDRAFT_742527 [Scleroderma citrinum Foug A]|uniref:Uncharacterized protein n=1 Tax=Scleroderma citrinum Foug A TaxID=1036808 RepID=A0A0C3D3A8_9AGAM|nr:hypothetical protein SCLCIDRAFT_742527 [Scleroderma citrinum Foug A]
MNSWSSRSFHLLMTAQHLWCSLIYHEPAIIETSQPSHILSPRRCTQRYYPDLVITATQHWTALKLWSRVPTKNSISFRNGVNMTSFVPSHTHVSARDLLRISFALSWKLSRHTAVTSTSMAYSVLGCSWYANTTFLALQDTFPGGIVVPGRKEMKKGMYTGVKVSIEVLMASIKNILNKLRTTMLRQRERGELDFNMQLVDLFGGTGICLERFRQYNFHTR